MTTREQMLRDFVEDMAEGDCGYGCWDGTTGSCETKPRVGMCHPCRARKVLAAAEREWVSLTDDETKPVEERITTSLRELSSMANAPEYLQPQVDRLYQIAKRLESCLPAPALPWIPVAERMPDNGDGDAERCVLWRNQWQTWHGRVYIPHDATHWLPLSAIPLPEGEG